MYRDPNCEVASLPLGTLASCRMPSHLADEARPPPRARGSASGNAANSVKKRRKSGCVPCRRLGTRRHRTPCVCACGFDTLSNYSFLHFGFCGLRAHLRPTSRNSNILRNS